MKWTAALLVVLFSALSGNGIAMWMRMTDAELIQRSDLIVAGEWMGEARIESPSRQLDLSVGVIAIKEVLKGDARLTIALVALPSAGGPISSTDIRYKPGQRGLWFLHLRSGERGMYLADHPQRFVADSSTAEIQALRKQLRR